MLEMIPLCGGAWIDPNGPVGVKIEFFDPGVKDFVPVWTVVVSSAGLRTKVDFPGAQEQAEAFANGIARQVNQARKKDRYRQ